jgi:gas vesicle protein
MSNREGFTSGFLAGATIGGLLGGILGVVLTNRLSEETSDERQPEIKASSRRKVKREAERIEMARMGLEEKISQLNQAIDDVRQQMGNVNGNVETSDRSSTPEQ